MNTSSHPEPPRRFSFGMAFSSMGMKNDAANLEDFLHFPEFNAAGLPWELFTASDTESIRIRDAFTRQCPVRICGSIMDSRLSCAIPFADKRMRRDFSEQLRHALEILLPHGITCAVLECPPETLGNRKDAETALREILQSTAPFLIRNSMTLLLPVSIPTPLGQWNTQSVARFFRDCMIPNIKIRLDVHPWDMEENIPPEQAAGRLAFETEALLFHYNADCGNRILKSTVSEWKNYLAAAGHDCPLLLSPSSRRNRMAFPEANLFAQIAGELAGE